MLNMEQFKRDIHMDLEEELFVALSGKSECTGSEPDMEFIERLANLERVKCPLCEIGHPVDKDGNHYPTQRLGMIPITKCKYAPNVTGELPQNNQGD